MNCSGVTQAAWICGKWAGFCLARFGFFGGLWGWVLDWLGFGNFLVWVVCYLRLTCSSDCYGGVGILELNSERRKFVIDLHCNLTIRSKVGKF